MPFFPNVGRVTEMRRALQGRGLLGIAALSLVSAPLLAGQVSHPRSVSADDVPAKVFDRLNLVRTKPATTFAGEPIHAFTPLARLYDARDYTPLWVSQEEPSPAAFAAARTLERAAEHGLEPSDYHHRAIVELLGAPAGTWQSGTLLDLELLLSDGLLHYGAQLASGRLRSGVFDPELRDFRHEVDLVAAIQEAASGDPTVVWEEIAPAETAYRDLQLALRVHREILNRGGWREIPGGPVLVPGSRAPEARLGPLRERLRASGDLGTGEDAPGFYDATLAEAVRRFQARNGLIPDGKLGPATIEVLAVSAVERVSQIELSLERFRWLPRELGRRYIRVDIAAYRLELVEQGETVLDMRVVVGRPDRPTAVFSDEVRYLVFHPFWEVPFNLAIEDELPAIQKDVGYVQQRNFDVLRGWPPNERSVDPRQVDWASLDRENFPYRLRQRPGPGNSLGRVKFMFPNRFSIYLHDTPRPELFKRAERDLSSGCIRVERPTELAAELLEGTPGWDRWLIDEVLASGHQSTVRLLQPMPIHLLYFTAWPDASGKIGFRKDIYDLDPALRAALDQRSSEQDRTTVPGTAG